MAKENKNQENSSQETTVKALVKEKRLSELTKDELKGLDTIRCILTVDKTKSNRDRATLKFNLDPNPNHPAFVMEVSSLNRETRFSYETARLVYLERKIDSPTREIIRDAFPCRVVQGTTQNNDKYLRIELLLSKENVVSTFLDRAQSKLFEELGLYKAYKIYNEYADLKVDDQVLEGFDF